jgi:hypothetical protein
MKLDRRIQADRSVYELHLVPRRVTMEDKLAGPRMLTYAAGFCGVLAVLILVAWRVL